MVNGLGLYYQLGRQSTKTLAPSCKAIAKITLTFTNAPQHLDRLQPHTDNIVSRLGEEVSELKS